MKIILALLLMGNFALASDLPYYDSPTETLCIPELSVDGNLIYDVDATLRADSTWTLNSYSDNGAASGGFSPPSRDCPSEDNPTVPPVVPPLDCGDEICYLDELTIFDENFGDITRIPWCIGMGDILFTRCPATSSAVGHEVFAMRHTWRYEGDLFGFFQATTINTMGSSLSAYKNVIIGVSTVPGELVEGPCSDLTASENSQVTVVTEGSTNALARPGRYCELSVGTLYYVNVRFDAGLSEDCGFGVQCIMDIVDQTPDIIF